MPSEGYNRAMPTIHQQIEAWKARLLDLRSEVASAFVNGKVYIIGGLARNQEASALNQEYDPASDIWRERRSMPQPLSHPNATVLNGKIYVVGGFMAQVHVGAQNAAFEYDPVADTWRTPGVLVRWISPPSRLDSSRLIARPRPVPP